MVQDPALMAKLGKINKCTGKLARQRKLLGRRKALQMGVLLNWGSKSYFDKDCFRGNFLGRQHMTGES